MAAIDQLSDRNIWVINGRFASQQMTGVQRYAHEIVRSLDEIISQDAGVANRLGFELVMPPCANNRPVLLRIESRQSHIGSGHAWDQFVLPWKRNSGVLSLGNFGPIAARNHIVCIHDANTFIEPDSYSLAFRAAYRSLLPLIGSRARRVATVSQFSAEQLVMHGVCRPEKIFIAPNGHEHALRWDSAAAKLPLIKNLKKPYVLLIGSNAKHKNIQVVLRQAEALDAAGIDIVVVGAASRIFEGEAELARPNVHYTGYVTDDDLAALYEGARCLVFPSKTEGFGIPPLEAMTRGCPVISSNAASLTEVGGDAVVYVDPDRSDGWRDAIVGIAANANLRAEMMAKGRKRTALFSWKRSAEIYVDEVLRLMEKP